MSDETAGAAKRRTKSEEPIVEAEIIESVDPVAPGASAAPPTVVEEVVVESVETAPASSAPPQAQVIYVHAPAEPVRKGNRGIGVVIAVLSSIVFTALLVLAVVIITVATGGRASFGFLGSAQFYLPTLIFIIAFVVLVLLANRAAWWAYILGSVIVGLVVYFGTIGALLLIGGVILMTPAEASAAFASGLTNPIIIAAALLAREVSLWTGSIIARRGRRVKERNATARADWEREVAEKRAEYERTVAGGATAV